LSSAEATQKKVLVCGSSWVCPRPAACQMMEILSAAYGVQRGPLSSKVSYMGDIRNGSIVKNFVLVIESARSRSQEG